MNEPKRRGRPPKAPIVTDEVHPNYAAQEYARRVWAGQSPSLSQHERLGRIADALKAQGMSMEGVELP